MIYLYNLVLLFFVFLALPYVSYRLLVKKDKISAYGQKLGMYDITPPRKGGVWIHAVSVGETNTAIPLVEEFSKRNPDVPVIFSTGTATGQALARKKLADDVTLAYFPLDFPMAVWSALSFFSPAVIVFMETEIWPNFIYQASRAGRKTMLVNGRISDRSYERYRNLKWFLAPFMNSINRLLMQSDTDAERAVTLGAEKESVRVTGNLKFDRPPPGENESREEIRRIFGIPAKASVVIFASTHPGEDELFLDASIKLKYEIEDIFTIIAPRHVERTADIKKLCIEYKLPVRLRSEEGETSGFTVMILDTYGELAKLYGAADLAVMGGSFIRHGGQNPLEAAAWKLPVIFGPHMENFRDISQKLLDSRGAVRAGDKAELIAASAKWLADKDAGQKAGLRGYNVILANRGALKKTVEAIEDLLEN